MLKAGVHPKVVSERLGHASIAITLDTYSHVLPGLQQDAAHKFDRALSSVDNQETKLNVGSSVGKNGESESEPCRARTCDPLIKSQMLYQLS